MNKDYTEKEVGGLWSSGQELVINGQRYRVGKMNYGEYFLEPPPYDRPETEPFNSGTLWLQPEIDKRGQVVYRIT